MQPSRCGPSPICHAIITPANPSNPHRILRSAGEPKPNITGFEMRKFLASTGRPRYDPWERAYVAPRSPHSIEHDLTAR